jgi:hypothetical protein
MGMVWVVSSHHTSWEKIKEARRMQNVCDHPECSDLVVAPSRRFCEPHRQEHAAKLLRQLQEIQDRTAPTTDSVEHEQL